jgi:hypothetical protein
LIELAAGLLDQRTKTEEPPDPNFLDSTSDAEKISGLDLKTPSLIPLGMEFSSAQVLPANRKVFLRYGTNNEMVIQEWEGTPPNFDGPSQAITSGYEIVDVGGSKALLSFSKSITPYWFMWWSQGKMNYQIYYYQYLSDGGTLNKEKMIAIAESMSDINVVRGNTIKSYDYVAAYEQSLGFDVKEFPTPPAGWSFTNVSASAHPDCITISYGMKKGARTLSLIQCNSDMDKTMERYNIPTNVVEQVKVGDHNGQYIMGYVEFQGTGKAVWNINLPYRILRWQEDGNWKEIMIRGDSILLYDKEDLISYAESLR